MPKKKADPDMQENTAPEKAAVVLPEQTEALPVETDGQEPLLLDEADDEMLAAASGQDPLLIDEVEEASDEAEETACEPMPVPDFQTVSEEPRKEKPARRRRKAVEPPEGALLPEEGAKKPAGGPPPPRRADPVLTIVAHEEIQTPEELEETAWHEIKNAYLFGHPERCRNPGRRQLGCNCVLQAVPGGHPCVGNAAESIPDA